MPPPLPKTLMPPQSLALTPTDFAALNAAKPAQVEQHFAGWLSGLHDFLNASPTLSRIQQVRGIRPRGEAFKTKPRYHPEHWYTYHHGGRSEAQFNIGMFTGHLRFGIGFEPTGGGYGKPDAIRTAQRRFADALNRTEDGAKSFCARNCFVVEVNAAGGGVTHEPIQHFLDVVAGHKAEERWIFVGRVLNAKEDRAVLEDASALAEEMERVFDELWPLWRATRP